MKVSCLQENLTRGLSIVSRAVATRSTLPILGNIKLETDEGRLKLSATNLEIGIHCWIGAQVHEEGATTVPARLLSDFVNSLPPDRIDMELNTRTQSLHLRCARFSANIKGLDAQDFPLIPTAGADHTVQISADLLREMVNQVAFAAATDESRPILTGVLATFEGQTLTMAAADGFRLSVRTEAIDNSADDKLEIIIPARALNELSRTLGASDEAEPVQVTVTANQIVFHMSSIELVSRLIEGNFPNYRQIIPARHDIRARVSTHDLLKAVRIAALFARDAANVVRLDLTPGPELTPGRIVVTSSADQLGDNLGEVDAIIEGEAAVIAFNAKFLADVLGVLNTEEVALEMTTSSSPGVFKPVGKEGFLHVIMPMHLGAR
ncbi:MAG: DNA polymerase III subunit beta [Chloroflexi bacterium]|nr:DNA polymerase III subunit beta [Chloroflexota bacterium]